MHIHGAAEEEKKRRDAGMWVQSVQGIWSGQAGDWHTHTHATQLLCVHMRWYFPRVRARALAHKCRRRELARATALKKCRGHPLQTGRIQRAKTFKRRQRWGQPGLNCVCAKPAALGKKKRGEGGRENERRGTPWIPNSLFLKVEGRTEGIKGQTDEGGREFSSQRERGGGAVTLESRGSSPRVWKHAHPSLQAQAQPRRFQMGLRGRRPTNERTFEWIFSLLRFNQFLFVETASSPQFWQDFKNLSPTVKRRVAAAFVMLTFCSLSSFFMLNWLNSHSCDFRALHFWPLWNKNYSLTSCFDF